MKKITLAGSVTVFVIILLGLIIGFYLMGYKSPMLSLVDKGLAADENGQQPEINAFDFIHDLFNSFASQGWLLVSIFGIATIIALFNASSLVAFMATFLPVLILLFVSNLLFFPVVTDMQSSGFTIGPLGVVIAAVLNVLLMLACIEFISGRS